MSTSIENVRLMKLIVLFQNIFWIIYLKAAETVIEHVHLAPLTNDYEQKLESLRVLTWMDHEFDRYECGGWCLAWQLVRFFVWRVLPRVRCRILTQEEFIKYFVPFAHKKYEFFRKIKNVFSMKLLSIANINYKQEI